MEGLYMRLSTENSITTDLAENREFKLKLLRISGFFLMIIVGYLFLKGNLYSKLASYFVYMSVACSIIPLPSPPYVIGMGKIELLRRLIFFAGNRSIRAILCLNHKGFTRLKRGDGSVIFAHSVSVLTDF